MKSEKNEIGAAADAKFVEQIRDVELDRALGDIDPAGDFFIRKIFEERIEYFLRGAGEVSDGVSFEATPLTGENGIHEAGEQLTRHPEAAVGHKGQGANQLVARFDISQKALYAEAEKRKTVGVVVALADDDEARFGVAFQNVGEERTRCGAWPSESGGMRPPFPFPARISCAAATILQGSLPTSKFVPSEIVTGRSVFSRRVRQGTPSAVVSS